VIRNLICIACLAAVLPVGPVAAQDWARKMFDSTNHNFGTVARGSKVEHSFTVTNVYQEEVHLVSVRSSCGCTTPTIANPTLKTWDKGKIVTQFNTRAFTGDKNAVITVTIDKPFYAEVQLQVAGYIRTDVVLDPGFVDFGNVDQGGTSEKKINIAYAGRDTWKIVDVQSANRYLEAQLVENSRGSGQVSYQLAVRLKGDAPVGYLKDHLTLVTNDERAKEIPVDVEGQIVADLSVSPASLFMGVVQPGQKVTKQLVVRGKKPFRIKEIECEDKSFAFKIPEASAAVHLVPVTFEAGKEPGKVTQKIRIQTDLGEGVSSELNAYAEVVKGS
jgi:uncharacterized protein DUF1573